MNFSSSHNGPQIDNAVTIAEDLILYANGWTKLPSTPENPMDLDALINVGNYTVAHFINGATAFSNMVPINISVVLVNGTTLVQYVYIKDGVIRREFGTDTWNEWIDYKLSSYIYIQTTAPENVPVNALWIDISNASNPLFKIYSGSVAGWTDIAPYDMMKKSVYDPNNHATDIYSYIDAQLTALNVSTVASNLSTHENNSTIHVTTDQVAGWNAKEEVANAQSKVDTALATSKAYTDTKISDNLQTASNIDVKVTSVTTTLNAHENNKSIHLTSDEKLKWDNSSPIDHEHKSDGRVEIDASKVVSGVLDIARIPQSAIEDLVTVANDAERFALTKEQVQKGDSVYVTEGKAYYFVVDETNLNNASGYKLYSAGIATSAAWENITGKPSSLSGYGITDAYSKTEVDNSLSSALSNVQTYVSKLANNMDDIIYERTSGTSNDLWSITYGNNLYVAVGFNGTILTSTDGITWTSRSSGTNNYLYGITYGNNIFVAVGYTGTILTSPDGITWTSRTSGTTNYLRDIIYGNNLFVAVGDEGTIVTSTDGITWTPRNSGVSSGLRSITYGNDLFIAVGWSGAILTSPDGITWTNRTSGISSGLGITYGNDLFIAVGWSGAILTSPDGITWTSRTSGTSNHLLSIIYGNNIFVTVGASDTVLTSTDGITWTSRTSGTSNDLNGITYGNNLFVAVGNSGTILQITFGLDKNILNANHSSAISRDKANDLYDVYPLEILTNVYSGNVDNPLRSITYGNNLFVAVGDGGTILTSSDGITWTSRTSGTTNNLLGITYGNNIYVIVGVNGTILTSPDGITWTSRTSGVSSGLRSITYGNNLFVAVGYTGTILTSPDCITWTSRSSGTTNYLRGITYCNNLYVAVGYKGTILTSTDGITWTSRSSGTSNTLHGIIYGNNLFVAVGYTGTILTSTDGITWTSRTSGVSDALRSITYGNNLFVAVGVGGTILTSPDAITWTSRTGVSNYWYLYTYNNKCLVVYDNSIGLSIMGISKLTDYVDLNLNIITTLKSQILKLQDATNNINGLYSQSSAIVDQIYTYLG